MVRFSDKWYDFRTQWYEKNNNLVRFSYHSEGMVRFSDSSVRFSFFETERTDQSTNRAHKYKPIKEIIIHLIISIFSSP